LIVPKGKRQGSSEKIPNPIGAEEDLCQLNKSNKRVKKTIRICHIELDTETNPTTIATTGNK
jgi:hypothetical protein